MPRRNAPPPLLVNWLAPFVVLAASGGAALAANTFEGRWEGEARIPGAPAPLVVDVESDGSAGWVASVILPGRGVKGAAARDVVVDADGALHLTIGAAFAAPVDPPPALTLRAGKEGALDGELRLAGLAAPVALHRTGPPQVDRAPHSTPLSARLAGTWAGRYELGGYPRDVTLMLSRDAAKAVVVGKRTTEVPFDLVVEGEHFLTLTASAFAITIELRIGTDALDGTFVQGPFEAALTLHRAPGDKP